MADASVKISLEIATKAAEIALQNFQKATKDSDAFWGRFKANVASLISYDAIKGAANAVLAFGTDLITASIEGEQAAANLDLALKAAGITAEGAATSLIAYSEQIERTTSVSASAAQSTMKLLADTTNLTETGIKQATSAVIDLSTALGIDLDSATKLIAQGIQGNISAFQRYGIQVKSGGDETQRFTNILESLGHFQGRAAQQATTTGGTIQRIGSLYGQLQEKIGDLITQSPIFQSALEFVSDTLVGLIDFVQRNGEEIKMFGVALAAASGIVLSTVTAMKLMTLAAATNTTAFGALGIAAKAAWAAVTGPIGLTVLAIGAVGTAIYSVIKYWDEIKAVTYDAAAAVLDYGAVAAQVFSPKTAEAMRAQASEFRSIADATRQDIEAKKQAKLAEQEASKEREKSNQLIRDSNALTKEEQKQLTSYVESLIKAAEARKTADNDRLAQLQTTTENEQAILRAQLENNEIDYITYQERRNELDVAYDAARQETIAQREAAEQERLTAARENNLVSEEQYQIAKGELESKYETDREKLRNDIEKRRIKQTQEAQAEELKQRKATLSATASFFGAMGDLYAQGGKETFEIAKAFNLAEAITSGILAVQNALASPGGFIAAAAMAVATAANVARIASTKPPSFATGGVVGGFNGASMGGDNTLIHARTGEMIINAAQQRNLYDMANTSQSTNGDLTSMMSRLISVIENNPVVVNIGGETVVNTIRSELQAGRTFA